jgi:hypothetical protein
MRRAHPWRGRVGKKNERRKKEEERKKKKKKKKKRVRRERLVWTKVAPNNRMKLTGRGHRFV